MNFYHDVARNLLIYPLVAPHLAAALPDARVIRPNGRDFLAVPRTLHNLQVLRWYDHPVPPIITDKTYDWPIEPGRKPLAHQRVMTNFMVLHRRCFNLSDMGAMKTMSALWAADWLMQQHENFRALIVAPLSTLETVWANAIFKNFLSRRSFEILHGDAARRLGRLNRLADFSIINFDGVGTDAHVHKRPRPGQKRIELDGFSKALADRSDIKLVIVDEASAYKDSTTQRHHIARQVIGTRDYLWLLTGTPTPNAPTDAYGLAKMVNNAFGKSFDAFKSETMIKAPHSNFRWFPARDGYTKARALLTPSIRYDLKDVWDGPEMSIQQREVPLTDEQIRLLATLKKNLQVVVASGKPITADNESAARQKFMQISLGAIYDEAHDVHYVDAKPRFAELKAIIDQAPGKILIFAGLTSVVNLLYRELKAWSREVVNGDVGTKERARIFAAFQNADNPRLLIADPGTMAHGLDLWRAQTVIWYGPTDKAELYAQANRRAHRPGQRFPVSVVQVVSNKLEQEIYRRLETNTSLQGALLDMIRRGEL